MRAAKDLALELARVSSASPQTYKGFVQASRVVAAAVGPTEYPGQIALILKDGNGVDHHYLLPATLSTALRPQMASADKAAPAGVKLPRA